ncbi:MAG TPA: helix-turn-helix transcriptional regulator [Arthrobacter sp.]
MDPNAALIDSLSTQIRMELVGLDMEQQELADAVPIARATLSKYLMGHRTMPMPTFFKVAEILGVKPSVLLERAAARIAP